jgi:hypothetical protein
VRGLNRDGACSAGEAEAAIDDDSTDAIALVLAAKP